MFECKVTTKFAIDIASCGKKMLKIAKSCSSPGYLADSQGTTSQSIAIARRASTTSWRDMRRVCRSCPAKSWAMSWTLLFEKTR